MTIYESKMTNFCSSNSQAKSTFRNSMIATELEKPTIKQNL